MQCYLVMPENSTSTIIIIEIAVITGLLLSSKLGWQHAPVMLAPHCRTPRQQLNDAGRLFVQATAGQLHSCKSHFQAISHVSTLRRPTGTNRDQQACCCLSGAAAGMTGEIVGLECHQQVSMSCRPGNLGMCSWDALLVAVVQA